MILIDVLYSVFIKHTDAPNGVYYIDIDVFYGVYTRSVQYGHSSQCCLQLRTMTRDTMSGEFISSIWVIFAHFVYTHAFYFVVEVRHTLTGQ